MALLGAMGAAISGLGSFNQWMTVIGNNIANDNTTGYKSSTVEFSDLFSQTLSGASGYDSSSNTGGIDPRQIGLGTQISSVSMNMTQGAIQTASSPTDMAIQGNGFFVTKTGLNTTYTRDGSFSFDNDGNLVSPSGAIAQGWVASEIQDGLNIPAAPAVAVNTVIQGDSITMNTSDTSAITNINIPQHGLTIAQQTTLVDIQGNLDQNTAANATDADITAMIGLGGTDVSTLQGGGLVIPSGDTNPFANVTPDATTSTTVYDSLGNPQEVTFWYLKDANNADNSPTWDWYAFDTTGGVTPSNTNCIGGTGLEYTNANAPNPNGLPNVVTGKVWGTIQFNADGSLANNGGFPTAGANAMQADPILCFQPAPPDAGTLVLNDGAISSMNFQVHFGTPNTWANAGNNLAGGDPVAQVNNVFEFGKRDGLTGDVTGSYQLENGVETYVPNSDPNVKDQNGYTDGTLNGVSVDQSGNIVGSFTNGKNITLARVALANFANPDGLTRVGGNQYMSTSNSGLPVVGSAGTFGLGNIEGGSLEGSNVDLATELTNMIIAQRGFESNARVVTEVDNMLGTLDSLGQGGV